MNRRLPALWTWHTERWRKAIIDFALRDHTWRLREGWCHLEAEIPFKRRLTVAGQPLALHGRFDRRLSRDQTAGGEQRIGDYKTSQTVGAHVKKLDLLRGNRLQAALYRLAADDAPVELLAVAPGVEPEDAVASFDGFEKPEQQDGFEETLATLLDFQRHGEFPFHDDTHCNFCPFDAACRRKHQPSVEREAHSVAGRLLAAVKRKILADPLLPQELRREAADG